ncbi:hypothetical protein C2S53_014321 [Perilla frutescens var. hirtella]|uniref:Uncharacterized protein n=1 Tax=Perilla frutescens var. hirtella TaxID=608512 RepID=A0AAD4P5E4_PERFH|nr:hypothetical protein C2S53_014321 [Perilla frutescens var. hirtella]
MRQPMQKTLSSAANLANLLPTGTVLAFQTLAPPFSNRGICRISNKCLTASLVGFCSVVCFLSSFTDSFTDSDGKLYYGMATWKGMVVFNGESESRVDLSEFRMRLVDLVHAWVSVLVFLAFALSDVNVQSCFFPSGGEDLDVLVMNLPLAAGLFATFFFTLFPTTRRGIGYSDSPTGYTYVRPRSLAA